ncbi:DUF1295 domain-containing protein [Xanthomonas campestris pv. raphani]|uniref:DUF1295 domain-containing protein n=1 Tax=Xanthomonas campestris TaxID=339 RepID=UPI002B22A9B8|nr:DUF1295 domain-containing protein [Xanthomonas campestris]MEA9827783.1 DUF1295 domain-containing protein [Xanthomonas campestris pv. raphani]
MTVWPLLHVGVFAAVVMVLGWLWQCRSGNAGPVDVLWAGCLAVAAPYCAWMSDGALLPRVLVAVLGGVWGARLAWHLGVRVFGDPHEDGRYRALREHWNGDQRKFLGFFLAQAVVVVLFSVPFLAAASNPNPAWSLWSSLAIVVWLIAVGGEALADRQLSAHKANPANRGKTCRTGLWRYSRHPNYFFEFVHWFAYLALAVGAGPWPVALCALGPVVMFVFLYRFTGIPYTEQQALRSRGEDYAQYQRSTSAFFPFPPSS